MACIVASLRLFPARFVKYEIVMGTIGNTHGVSSDSAPISAANPRYAPIVLARDETARSGTRFAVLAAVFAAAAFGDPFDAVEAAEPGTPEPGTPELGTPEPGTPEPGTPEPSTAVSAGASFPIPTLMLNSSTLAG